MKNWTLMLMAFALSVPAGAGELYVLPVVVDGVPGLSGSLWETQIRIVKVDRADDIVIRRAWVCLEGGGFADEPSVAPTWVLPFSYLGGQSMLLSAADVLDGAGADRGAVALEVEGGELLIDISIVDVGLGGFIPFPDPQPYGIGQTYSAVRTPRDGATHFSWLGGCYGERSISDFCDNHYRNNIGLVNPNPGPMVFLVTVHQFVGSASMATMPREGVVYSLPPFGWHQFAWPLNVGALTIGTPFSLLSFPQFGVANIEPEDSLPYYAYISVVYTTPPGVSSPRVSDPYFQLAEPGVIAVDLEP